MQYSIVNLKDIQKHKDFRCDAEYYHPFYTDFCNSVDNTSPLSTYIEDGYRVVYENTYILNDKDIESSSLPNFLQAADIKTPMIQKEKMGKVCEEDWLRYKKGRIKPGELLIEVKGKAEKVAIVPEDFPTKTLVSGSLYKMIIKEKEYPEYILTYLLGKYGSSFKNRSKTNLLISFINKNELYNIPVPKKSNAFKAFISTCVKTSISFNKKSNLIYLDAQETLLSEFGLANWQPKHELSFVRKSSDFENAERFDAEYFQPKYDEVLNAIKSIKHKPLGKVASYKKGFEVGSEAYQEHGIPFIRVSDISHKGIDHFEKRISKELYEELDSKYTPHKDDVLMTKDGTIGITFVVDKTISAVLSGAFLKLKPKIDIEKEYLALVLNSIIGSQQIDKIAGGAIIAHLKPSDAEQIIIPLLSDEKQKQIVNKVLEAKEAQNKSLKLLEIAKNGVDKAIEKNESSADAWMKQELDRLDVDLGGAA